jgi:hypothetical protein
MPANQAHSERVPGTNPERDGVVSWVRPDAFGSLENRGDDGASMVTGVACGRSCADACPGSDARAGGGGAPGGLLDVPSRLRGVMIRRRTSLVATE